MGTSRPTPLPTAWVSTNFFSSFVTTRASAHVQCTPRKPIEIRPRAWNAPKTPSMTRTDPSNEKSYSQFSELLNQSTPDPSPLDDNNATTQIAQDEPNANTPTEAADEVLQRQYADFANRLGIDDEKRKLPSEPTRETIERAKPSSTEIDPTDYAKFEGLLGRTGGTGRKPQKGSKRWQSTVEPESAHPATSAKQTVGESSGQASMHPDSVKPRSVFSEEDAADGYTVLTEQFGTGFHDAIDQSDTPSARRTSPKPSTGDQPALLRPPSRPADVSNSQQSTGVPKTTFVSNAPVPSAEPPPQVFEDSPKLQPKPRIASKAHASEDVELERESDSTEEVVPAEPVPAPVLEGKPMRPVSSPPPRDDEPESTVPHLELQSPVQLKNKPARPESAPPPQVGAVEGEDYNDSKKDETSDEKDLFVVGVDDTDGFTTTLDGITSMEDSENGSDGSEEMSDSDATSDSDAPEEFGGDESEMQKKRRREQFWEERGGRQSRNVPYRQGVSTPFADTAAFQAGGTMPLQNPKWLYRSLYRSKEHE